MASGAASTIGLWRVRIIVAAAVMCLGGRASAGEAAVAFAANFAGPMKRLEAHFEQETGHRLTAVPGSTGKLYAQIVNGAPFDVFLAADAERPRRLVETGYAASGSEMTYALGRLALWSPDKGRVSRDGARTLREGNFRHLALANPDLAPYGAAAMEVLGALDLTQALRPKIVLGENVGQAYALIASGNAELGFVARSLVRGAGGSLWDVPQTLHAPIRQDAVLLVRAKDNGAARAFLAYLASGTARDVIVQSGYGVE